MVVTLKAHIKVFLSVCFLVTVVSGSGVVFLLKCWASWRHQGSSAWAWPHCWCWSLTGNQSELGAWRYSSGLSVSHFLTLCQSSGLWDDPKTLLDTEEGKGTSFMWISDMQGNKQHRGWEVLKETEDFFLNILHSIHTLMNHSILKKQSKNKRWDKENTNSWEDCREQKCNKLNKWKVSRSCLSFSKR